jgi:hypothetical protein
LSIIPGDVPGISFKEVNKKEEWRRIVSSTIVDGAEINEIVVIGEE